MPGLKAFLQKTMIFTAAAPADLYAAKLGPSDAIVPTKPVPMTRGDVATRAVFHWTHDPSAPAKITNLTANVRAMNSMTMQVCDSIEVERVAISLSANSPLVLPMDVDHVVAKFKLDNGQIPGSSQGWWRLEANVDCSMAVVFAYEIVGVQQPYCRKVKLSDLEHDSAFPTPPVGAADPDQMDASAAMQPAPAGQAEAEAKTLEHAVTAVPPRHFVVVVFSLATCKERADFEPGGILGAGRVYPHVMVLSNQGLANAETTLHIKRPARGMIHDDMDGQIAPLLATDADVTHGPLPTWSNVFNYVVTDPLDKIGLIGQGDTNASGSNWMTVVDPTKKKLVPSDQTVKIGLTGPSSFRYFAMTTPGQGPGSIDAGTWTVFNHHGSAYALGIASTALWAMAGAGVQSHAFAFLEPYGGNSLLPGGASERNLVNTGAYNAAFSTPAFYFRLRWTGHLGGDWVERLQILDISLTTGVRS